MLKILLTPFILLAATGLITTIIFHLSSILRLPFEHYNMVFYLAGGVFIVWLPTVLLASSLTKEFKQKDFWKAAMRGCPIWLKKSVYIIFVYAVINFIYMMITGPDEDEISTARFISGHLLPFYAAALGTLYSAVKIDMHDNTRRCENGHPISPAAKFCEECGASIKNSAE